MLYLKNIVKSENVIEAEFSPEDSKWWGHISVNTATEEVVCDNNENYGLSYKAHAMWKLLEIVKSKEDITECTVMWY